MNGLQRMGVCLMALGLTVMTSQLGCGDGATQTEDMTVQSPDMAVQSQTEDMAVQSPDMAVLTDLAVSVPALSLVAGGIGGLGNTDGIGTATRFKQPSGMALDSAGNLYVADTNNHTIRKVVVQSGVVTTLAGTAGAAGNVDGTGAAARFNSPQGLALDGAGNLYVADSGNCTIRKIVVGSGVVTTLVGSGASGSTDGAGAAAQFNSPQGLTLDGAGNLYVADSGNSTIRKVVVGSGVVTTLAGTAYSMGITDGTGAAARFNLPVALALDGAGNLYVADYNNCTIRKVVVGSGVVTTLAGTGGICGSNEGSGARFANPGGITYSSGNLYVADSANNTIRQVAVAEVVTTLAGTAGVSGSTDGTGSAAQFNDPLGVVADGAGNLYVADSRNNTIRKVVVQSGVVTTLAGAARLTGSTDGTGAAARFKSPVGVAADGANNLYIADTFNNTIRKVVVQSGVVTTLAGTAGVYGSADGTGAAAKFVTPQGVAADGAGNLYVADSGNNTIRKVVVQSGVVTTLAGTAGMAGSTDGTGAAALFNVPQGVAVDAAGNLYVADTFNHTIRKVVVQSGVVTTLAGTAGMAGSADGTGSAALFNYPQGVAVDGAGNVYVADSGNNTIRKVVVQSGLVTTLAGTVGMTGSTDGTGSAALFSTPLGVAVDGAGNLYISDSVNRTLRKMALSSGSVTTLVGAAGQQGVKLGQLRGSLNSPAGVAVTSAGVLFIVDKSENAVLAVR